MLEFIRLTIVFFSSDNLLDERLIVVRRKFNNCQTNSFMQCET